MFLSIKFPTKVNQCFKNQCLYNTSVKFVILQSIGIIAIKVEKQGQSSTPADISGHLNYNFSFHLSVKMQPT